MLLYNHVTAYVFIDTLFAENTSKIKRHFTCDKVSVTEFGYTYIFLIKSKGYLHDAMNNLFNNFEVPPSIIDYFTGEQVQGEAQRSYKKFVFQIQKLEKRMLRAKREKQYMYIFKKSIT